MPERIYGYAVGIDLTRRDLQAEAKAMRRPWDTGKGFDKAAPCSRSARSRRSATRRPAGSGFRSMASCGRTGDINQLIWSVTELTATLSRYFKLMPGDLIFTGTPSGVGPISKGDKVEGGVEGVAELSIEIV